MVYSKEDGESLMDSFFCARNIVCNLILNGTDPLGIHAKGQVYQEQAKELGKQLAYAGFLACSGRPTQGR